MANKESLRKTIIDALAQDLSTASNAADTARATATSKETVAENKYDTFGLEASYLAHGQSIRVEELQHAIDHYTSLPFKAFGEDDEIELSATIALIPTDNNKNGNEKVFFIGPAAGGLKIHWNNTDIMVITTGTPLGRQLLGKQLDDVVTLIVNHNPIEYEIIAIY